MPATQTVPLLLTSAAIACTGAPHAFSTRVGGVSAGVFDSLNFGNPGELPAGVARDPRDAIEENFRRTLDAMGCAGRRIVQVHQVHGNVVHVEPEAPRANAIVWGDVKADAIVTSDPGCVVAVRVADCCPVLLASHDGRVVGAVHAGWRGVVLGAVTRAIEAMRTLGAERISAAIGPCISGGAFEVGPEVREEFVRAFGGEGFSRAGGPERPGKFDIDLKAALAHELRVRGVSEIDTRAECTVGRPDLFFSHRRDKGVTGRMIGAVGPRST